LKDQALQEITSNQNPKFRAAVQLQTSRGRRQQNRIIIFGWREIERALKNAVAIREIFVCPAFVRPEILSQVARCAEECGSEIYQVPEVLFEKLRYGDRADGMVAIATRPASSLADFSVSGSSFFLVVQGLEKPGNLGAIVRSADGAGAQGVIVVDGGTDAYHPNSIRASMGTVFSMPVAVTTTEIAIAWLRCHGIRILIARPDAPLNYYDVDLRGRLAIVLGNEAQGLTKLWDVPDCVPVKLPMNGIADSLNVSVSASIMAYEAYRQRRSNVTPT
jgi:TrmH family RNA methyltransferase